MRLCRLVCLWWMVGVAAAGAQVTGTPQRAGSAAVVEPVGELLDINTATPAQLRTLPGMGDAYVRRVIAGRPYTAKNQLVTRGVLPQEAYQRIRPLIIAKRPAHEK
jgi:DNA uptake protein ComE-like DNA-binding protein